MSVLINTDHFGLSDRFRRTQGKVRDTFYLPGNRLAIVTTDRMSAFDVVFPNAIPGKGKALHAMSMAWMPLFYLFFESLLAGGHRFQHHLLSTEVGDLPEEFHPFRAELEGRTAIVRQCDVLPLECIVRGFISGSYWKEYLEAIASQVDELVTVHGFSLPRDLLESEKLPRPIFTPSTKAVAGAHDENINYQQMLDILTQWLGDHPEYAYSARELAEDIESTSLGLYTAAQEYSEERGIIVADTKFEFGLTVDDNGQTVLTLLDEVVTSDSSRFWQKATYKPGRPQVSFDKQPVRDYLERIGWNKKPPAPELPPDIVKQTTARYLQAAKMLFDLDIAA